MSTVTLNEDGTEDAVDSDDEADFDMADDFYSASSSLLFLLYPLPSSRTFLKSVTSYSELSRSLTSLLS